MVNPAFQPKTASAAACAAPQPVAATPATPLAKRLGLLLALALVCLLCTACALLGNAAVTVTQAAGPNLALLALPAYDDPDAGQTQTADTAEDYMPVDLWLDATQNMGGINPSVNSMYPHASRKYREGGFHYHYGYRTGWYENLLMDFLTAAGETRVRTLRYGNEYLPESFLDEYGLTAANDEARASVWRDMHTAALEKSAGLFNAMAADDMSASFYALGSAAWVNRLTAFDTQGLENPTLAGAMSTALDAQIAGIADGDSRFVLTAGANGEQCALYTALDNLDVNKLSVITVDPASVRKVSGTDDAGKPLAFYEALLRQKGVFDLGLCVGVLDFQLDYIGQIASVSTANLSEPLIWGHVILNDKKQTFINLGVMPRRMLTLVIGTRARVEGFIDRLSTAIDADRALQGLRGPQNGELSYTENSQTVTQQPFSFEWNHTVIARPGMGYYTQHTQGATLAVENTALDGAADTVTDTAAQPNATASTGESTGAVNQASTNTDASKTTDESTGAAKSTGATQTAAESPAITTAAPISDSTATTTAAPVGDSTVTTSQSGLPLVSLAPDEKGQYASTAFSIRFPITQNADGAQLDVSSLSGAGIRTLSNLVLTKALANTPQNAAAGGAQTIPYRDKLYVFEQNQPIEAFTLTGITQSGNELVCTVAVNGGALQTGYYRLRLGADVTGEQVAWETVPWIDGAASVSATVTDAQVYAWETLTAAITEYDRDAKGMPRMFLHAWGGYTEKLYHGLRIPDCPPVYRSIHLAELAAQFRGAAASDTSPLIRYAFEVFAGNP